MARDRIIPHTIDSIIIHLNPDSSSENANDCESNARHYSCTRERGAEIWNLHGQYNVCIKALAQIVI
jgi:hypothetical protein